jgi:hypothetical protein
LQTVFNADLLCNFHTWQVFRVAVAFLTPDCGTLGISASAGKRRRSPGNTNSTGDIVIDLTADETNAGGHGLELFRALLLLKVTVFNSFLLRVQPTIIVFYLHTR